MAKDEKDQDPTPVSPAPTDAPDPAAPSSTGVVDGDGTEPDEAKQNPT